MLDQVLGNWKSTFWGLIKALVVAYIGKHLPVDPAMQNLIASAGGGAFLLHGAVSNDSAIGTKS